MFCQLFRRYQTLLISIGGGLLVLGGWFLLSNFQLGDTEQKIYEMGKRLAANGPWTAATEEQYRIERAKILTKGMDSLSALKHLQKLKEHHKSIAEYAERAVREHPNNVEALLDWAFYLDIGSDESTAVYRRVLELDPNSAEALNHLGMSVAYDDPHTAIEYFTKVEELQNPEVGTYYSSLAIAYQRLGEYNKAMEVYRKGYETSPHSRGGARLFSHLQDLEAGIYKIPLWQPEGAETGNKKEDPEVAKRFERFFLKSQQER